MNGIKACWRGLVSLLFPQRCLSCGKPVEAGRSFCTRCRKWELTEPVLRRLEAFLPGGRAFLCVAALPYREEIRGALYRFKFRGKRGMAGAFAQLMEAAAGKEGLLQRDTVITFVPMDKKRKRQRGYNQSEELAKELGNRTDLPVQSFLERTELKNSTQHTLPAKERRRNVKGAYRAAGDMKGKRILLVDDIVTTGATLRECAAVLYRAGAGEVSALCAASAEHSALSGQCFERFAH